MIKPLVAIGGLLFATTVALPRQRSNSCTGSGTLIELSECPQLSNLHTAPGAVIDRSDRPQISTLHTAPGTTINRSPLQKSDSLTAPGVTIQSSDRPQKSNLHTAPGAIFERSPRQKGNSLTAPGAPIDRRGSTHCKSVHYSTVPQWAAGIDSVCKLWFDPFGSTGNFLAPAAREHIQITRDEPLKATATFNAFDGVSIIRYKYIIDVEGAPDQEAPQDLTMERCVEGFTALLRQDGQGKNYCYVNGGATGGEAGVLFMGGRYQEFGTGGTYGKLTWESQRLSSLWGTKLGLKGRHYWGDKERRIGGKGGIRGKEKREGPEEGEGRGPRRRRRERDQKKEKTRWE
ncbi:hypothetical protein GQ43DRAFT_462078 [Delitschia confertaspora ATCC 74209]|uniref:Ecp2 effector protein domain-containing protein n=1 Tax=Delitschia confertaspora ATCC 74209 TaxID=1513339 RepID=A0A9P4JPG9_9PLEO|nr:hypothetical protein GQ43DRAFT_462078 [Delitschia confertaspora ATCC 74209]